jgi:hypothetical protein
VQRVAGIPLVEEDLVTGVAVTTGAGQQRTTLVVAQHVEDRPVDPESVADRTLDVSRMPQTTTSSRPDARTSPTDGPAGREEEDTMNVTTTKRRIRGTIATLALGAGLLALTPGTAHAAINLYPRGYCAATIDHSVNPSPYVSFAPICSYSGMWARMEVYDFDSGQWVWGNWTRAENGYTYAGDITGARSVYEKAYVEYAFYNAGWHYLHEVVPVHESADNEWGYKVNW